MEKLENYLTVVEAAERMKFTERTIRKWCANGSLPHCKIGRELRILESDIVAFIESGRAY